MYTDEVRVRPAPRSSHSKTHGGSFHRVFFFSGGMLVNLFFLPKARGVNCTGEVLCSDVEQAWEQECGRG